MATLWPFGPLWWRPWRISYEYRTDIIVSRSGQEQRRALRDIPRKRVEYGTTAYFDGQKRDFERAMVNDQRQLIDTPDVSRYVTLEGGLAALQTTVTLSAVPSWVVVGAQLALLDEGVVARRTVTNISGNDVTFSQSSSFAWPANTLLCASLTGRLNANLDSEVLVEEAVNIAAAIEVDPASDPGEDDGVPAQSFQGREAFLIAPVFTAPVGRNYDQFRELVDYGIGVVFDEYPITYNNLVQESRYTMPLTADSDALLGLFRRARGRRGEFYMPSFDDDLPLASGSGSGTSVLTVEGAEVASIYSGNVVYKAVAVYLPDGTWQLNNVVSIAPSGGNSVITVGTPWPVTIPADSEVSWMPLRRFASDTLEVEWLAGRVATAVFNTRALEDLPAEA